MTVRKSHSAEPDPFFKVLVRALAPSTEAVTIADSNGIIMFANDEVERVYRRTKKSVLKKHPLTFCPYDFSQDLSKKIFETINKKGNWDGIVMNIDAYGKRFPILLRTVRVSFASTKYIISWAKPFPHRAPFTLSSKQAQCFKLLGMGLTLKEVAAQLNISESTVKTHVNRIKNAITEAQSQADARSRLNNLIDISHLAVRCLEAGWDPMMKINTSIK